jgi:hypothetical protein
MVGLNNNMNKLFKPTYLCIKTHSVTGLKYFCKTTKHDYHSYPGSGIYWRRHLKEHGRSFTTELLGFYTNKEECNTIATKFSIDNDIVRAIGQDGKKIWANAIIENGLDGGAARWGEHSDETKEKIRIANIGKIVSTETKEKIKTARTSQTNVRKNGVWKHTEESKRKIKEKRAQQVITKESRKKAGEKLRGKKRPDVSVALTGKKKSPETIERMRLSQQNKGPMSFETKQKIKEKRKLQVFSDETREKLKGKIVCVDKSGEVKRIEKEIFYSQLGSDDQKDWVFHNSKEGKKRKQN